VTTLPVSLEPALGAADDVDADAEGRGPVVQVRDLEVCFDTPKGTVHALRGVSVDLRPGRIVALVGESGSGKSVLGSSILGLLPDGAGTRTSGSVLVGDVDMLDAPDVQRRAVRAEHVGAVFQDPLGSLNPSMRVGRQLAERGHDAAKVVEDLADAGVNDPIRRRRQWPHELSGGLRQRVVIAMALGAHPVATAGGYTRRAPELIVADEPTTALDVSVQAQILALFDRLRAEHGCAILLVTHDLAVAASIADDVVVLYGGRVCEAGPVERVLHRPHHPYTVGLLASRDASGGAPAFTGEPIDPLRPPDGCPFAPRCANVELDCLDQPPPTVALAAGEGQLACLHPVTVPVAPPTLVADEGAPGPPGAVTPAQALSREAPHDVVPALVDARPLLVVDGVSKGFSVKVRRQRRTLHAVSEVSLAVDRGRSLVLVGESGCGKTTLLNLAAGLDRPDAGSVWTEPSAGRPQLVFQDCGSSLTPWLTLGEQIRERIKHPGLTAAAVDERVVELLAQVGLDQRAAGSKPRQLSGGQRQRGAIARALASRPELLICDEPVSALDASLSSRILDLLDDLRARLGIGLLIVTHDLSVAHRLRDEVAVMYLGRIVERGHVDDVFADPKHPYTQGLLAAVPTFEIGHLSPTLEGEPPSPVDLPPGCAFAGRCTRADDVCLEAPSLRRLDGTREVACHHA
jgi:peptide/nickel transport system ATP-binding protein